MAIRRVRCSSISIRAGVHVTALIGKGDSGVKACEGLYGKSGGVTA